MGNLLSTTLTNKTRPQIDELEIEFKSNVKLVSDAIYNRYQEEITCFSDVLLKEMAIQATELIFSTLETEEKLKVPLDLNAIDKIFKPVPKDQNDKLLHDKDILPITFHELHESTINYINHPIVHLSELKQWGHLNKKRRLFSLQTSKLTKKVIQRPISLKTTPPSSTFTGRNDILEKMHSVMKKNGIWLNVVGPAGIGKTELVRKYVQQYREYFDGNVIWYNCEENMESTLYKLAELVNVPINCHIHTEIKKQINSICTESYHHFKHVKCLLVFDHSHRYRDIDTFLPKMLFPDYTRPNVIVTSRNKDWYVGDEFAHDSLELSVFKSEESVEYVKKLLNIKCDLYNDNINKLVDKLEHFPLALKQATEYIKQQHVVEGKRGDLGVGIPDCLKQFDRNQIPLLEFPLGDRVRKKTIVTIWDETFDKISENKDYGANALTVLNFMSYLSPESLEPLKLVDATSKIFKDPLWETIYLLIENCMVKVNNYVVSMHRLVQEVVRFKLRNSEKDIEILEELLNILLSQYDIFEYNLDFLIHHVNVLWRHSRQYKQLDCKARRLRLIVFNLKLKQIACILQGKCADRNEEEIKCVIQSSNYKC